MIYFNTKTVTQIQRQVYTGTKSVYTTLSGVTFNCYLRPLGEESNTSNGSQYGYSFNILCEVDVDIREGDKVTIDSVVYLVRGVVTHDRGGVLAYRRALITLPEN